MDFQQAKKVLQVTEARIKKFGASTHRQYELHDAIFNFQPFQRLVIAYHAQEALTHLRASQQFREPELLERKRATTATPPKTWRAGRRKLPDPQVRVTELV